MTAGQQVPMMVAMMLPSALPALVRRARAGQPASATALFAASYAAVWTVGAVVIYELWRPHSFLTAGVLTLAAATYELTPLKRACRERCRRETRSGLALGLWCAGSSLGLMVMLAAVALMSVGWMVLVGALVLAQKLLAPRVALDLPLAVAIFAIGIAVAAAPSAIPGLATS
jgi:predicted metal-binding membrane protein